MYLSLQPLLCLAQLGDYLASLHTMANQRVSPRRRDAPAHGRGQWRAEVGKMCFRAFNELRLHSLHAFPEGCWRMSLSIINSKSKKVAIRNRTLHDTAGHQVWGSLICPALR